MASIPLVSNRPQVPGAARSDESASPDSVEVEKPLDTSWAAKPTNLAPTLPPLRQSSAMPAFSRAAVVNLRFPGDLFLGEAPGTHAAFTRPFVPPLGTGQVEHLHAAQFANAELLSGIVDDALLTWTQPPISAQSLVETTQPQRVPHTPVGDVAPTLALGGEAALMHLRQLVDRDPASTDLERWLARQTVALATTAAGSGVVPFGTGVSPPMASEAAAASVPPSVSTSTT